MKKLILLLMLFSPLLWADLPFQPSITWTNPTEFNDGSALILDDLAEIRMYCSGASVFQVVVSTTPIGTSYTAPVGMFVAGDYACFLTAVTTLAHGGLESADSNIVNFTVSQKSPNPVINFGVL